MTRNPNLNLLPSKNTVNWLLQRITDLRGFVSAAEVGNGDKQWTRRKGKKTKSSSCSQKHGCKYVIEK